MMENPNTLLDQLVNKIHTENPSSRFRHQPQLSRLIREVEARHKTVLHGPRLLNEELKIETIEAQFDNMPV